AAAPRGLGAVTHGSPTRATVSDTVTEPSRLTRRVVLLRRRRHARCASRARLDRDEEPARGLRVERQRHLRFARPLDSESVPDVGAVPSVAAGAHAAL